MPHPSDGTFQCDICRTPLNSTDTCCWKCGAGKEHVLEVLQPWEEEQKKIDESVEKYLIRDANGQLEVDWEAVRRDLKNTPFGTTVSMKGCTFVRGSNFLLVEYEKPKVEEPKVYKWRTQFVNLPVAPNWNSIMDSWAKGAEKFK